MAEDRNDSVDENKILEDYMAFVRTLAETANPYPNRKLTLGIHQSATYENMTRAIDSVDRAKQLVSKQVKEKGMKNSSLKDILDRFKDGPVNVSYNHPFLASPHFPYDRTRIYDPVEQQRKMEEQLEDFLRGSKETFEVLSKMEQVMQDQTMKELANQVSEAGKAVIVSEKKKEELKQLFTNSILDSVVKKIKEWSEQEVAKSLIFNSSTFSTSIEYEKTDERIRFIDTLKVSAMVEELNKTFLGYQRQCNGPIIFSFTVSSVVRNETTNHGLKVTLEIKAERKTNMTTQKIY